MIESKKICTTLLTYCTHNCPKDRCYPEEQIELEFPHLKVEVKPIKKDIGIEDWW